MPTEEVHSKSGWDSLFSKYKLQLAALVYKMYTERVPPSLSTAITKRNDSRLRGKYRLVVPRFNTYYMKYSISHRGAIVWNALADNYNPSDSVRVFIKGQKRRRHCGISTSTQYQFRTCTRETSRMFSTKLISLNASAL